MTTVGWLGKDTAPIKEPPPVPARSLSPLLKSHERNHDRIVLGVLGTRSNIRSDEFNEQILAPITEAWALPDEILAPADGESSYVIQAWATKHGIPVTLVACDWVKQGRRAGILRDARIQRESTHLLLLQGPRSNAMTTLASRLERKGRPVVISGRPGRPVESPTAWMESLHPH
jgi:hypothetical protein